MSEPIELDAYEFVVCLLAAVARKGETDFVAPFSASRKATDAGANAAWVYLESHFFEAFKCRFALNNTGYDNRSEDWSEAVGYCQQMGLIGIDSHKSWTGYFLVTDMLQRAATKICADELPWDILADVYIETRNRTLQTIRPHDRV